MAKKSESTQDWLKRLHENPEFQKQQAEKERARLERQKRFAEESKELIQELADVGVVVSSVWDLVNSRERYDAAIPVLTKHLDKPYHKRIKEGIYRALGVKWLRDDSIVRKLFELFAAESDVDMRWVIGNSLSILIREQEQATIALRYIENPAFGKSRAPLIASYGAIYKGKAVSDIIRFMDDDELVAEAIEALGKLKAKEAKEKISSFTKCEDPWLRNKAKTALKKIG